MGGSGLIISIISLIAAYLLMSLLVMLTWNNGVKPAVQPGLARHIVYTEALALTAFIMLLTGGCTVVVAPQMKQAMSGMPSATSMLQ